ncbi:MAG TPA: phosphoesterase [Elusimicrobia bacterium]|nr:phosphoesterase [Elusimicrobiota bacterium]
MKILFVTDLHGDTVKYQLVLEIAKRNEVKAVINGGDMLCLEDDIHRTQREFIEGFLSDYFAEYDKAGIYHLGYLGNDDLKIHDACFNEICSKYPHAVNLAQARFELESFEFIGMNWVADYPFQLKDRCRRDNKDYVFQRQFGAGVLSTEKGFEELSDWVAHAATLPTIEEELELLPKPKNPDKNVYVMHMPPNRIGLDICQDGRGVGSQAIYNFIKKRQPRLTLHGHIHESPSRTGIWNAKIGETVCIQPGQLKSDLLSYVIINLNDMNAKRFEEPSN